MMIEITLTKAEEAAIRTLKRLATKWPDTLWLYAASGTLTVMRKNEDGEQAMTSIECDGGDW